MKEETLSNKRDEKVFKQGYRKCLWDIEQWLIENKYPRINPIRKEIERLMEKLT